MGTDSQIPEKDTENGDNMLQQLIQRSHHNYQGTKQITKAIGPHEDILTTVKSGILSGMGMSRVLRNFRRQ